MLETITSFDNATVGSGTAINQVEMAYNDFSQLITESQEHSGTVGGSTPNVQYAYASGGSSSNQIRPTTLTYPDGYAITYDYGTPNATNDRISRVASIKGGSVTHGTYTYLGAGTIIRVDYPQPDDHGPEVRGGSSHARNCGRRPKDHWHHLVAFPRLVETIRRPID